MSHNGTSTRVHNRDANGRITPFNPTAAGFSPYLNGQEQSTWAQPQRSSTPRNMFAASAAYSTSHAGIQQPGVNYPSLPSLVHGDSHNGTQRHSVHYPSFEYMSNQYVTSPTVLAYASAYGDGSNTQQTGPYVGQAVIPYMPQPHPVQLHHGHMTYNPYQATQNKYDVVPRAYNQETTTPYPGNLAISRGHRVHGSHGRGDLHNMPGRNALTTRSRGSGTLSRHHHNSLPPRADPDISVRMEPSAYTREFDGMYTVVTNYGVLKSTVSDGSMFEVRITIFNPKGWQRKESRVVEIESELVWQLESHANKQGWVQRFLLVTAGKKHADAHTLDPAAAEFEGVSDEGVNVKEKVKCRQVLRIDSNFPLKFNANKSAGNATPHSDHFVIDIDRHPGKLMDAFGKEVLQNQTPPIDTMDPFKSFCAREKASFVEAVTGIDGADDGKLREIGVNVEALRMNVAAALDIGKDGAVGGGHVVLDGQKMGGAGDNRKAIQNVLEVGGVKLE